MITWRRLFCLDCAAFCRPHAPCCPVDKADSLLLWETRRSRTAWRRTALDGGSFPSRSQGWHLDRYHMPNRSNFVMEWSGLPVKCRLEPSAADLQEPYRCYAIAGSSAQPTRTLQISGVMWIPPRSIRRLVDRLQRATAGVVRECDLPYVDWDGPYVVAAVGQIAVLIQCKSSDQALLVGCHQRYQLGQ